MNRRLIHYSDKPLEQIETRPFNSAHHNAAYKPNGLWVSAEGEDDWPAWCRGEKFGLDRLKHAAEIVLKPGAQILRIETARELLRFTENYGIKRKWPYDTAIDWNAVYAAYQGIVIAPYQWTERLSLFWYYGWDCASGCIWDAAAVATIRPVETVSA